jgi:N-acetylglucosaminyldiphosphoundecaprenol N-acetyl-beta-D-mannosaminyltransferase
MNKVNIAGLQIDSVTKKEFLDAALTRIQTGQKTFVTTPYSEFLYHAFREPKLLEIFNKTDFALADGIGIFWAKKYLEIPLTAKSYWGKILQAAWQMKYSLAAIIFNPGWIKSALPEKIVGADLVWDLAELAAENNLSIYLLGGFGTTAEATAKKLSDHVSKNRGRGFNQHWSNKNPGDPSVVDDINEVKPDILFVAYGPIKQEKWIVENLPKLNVKLAIGVGGSFDYIAGVKSVPPKFVRYSGMEWLWRLITQPYRFKRIINATFGLVVGLVRYKIFNSYGLRKNGVAVILNSRNEVFVGRKTGSRVDIITNNAPQKWANYWQLPQGGIEGKENIVEAIEREVKEETGIGSLTFLRLSDKTYTYFWNNSLRKLKNNKKYLHNGQTQSIGYFKLGSEVTIKLPSNEEFIEYKWVKPEDLDKVIHQERLGLTKIVQQDLKEMQEKAII